MKKVMGLFSQVTFGKAVVTIFIDDSSGRRLAAAFSSRRFHEYSDECVCKFLRDDDDEDHHGGSDGKSSIFNTLLHLIWTYGLSQNLLLSKIRYRPN